MYCNPPESRCPRRPQQPVEKVTRPSCCANAAVPDNGDRLERRSLTGTRPAGPRRRTAPGPDGKAGGFAPPCVQQVRVRPPEAGGAGQRPALQAVPVVGRGLHFHSNRPALQACGPSGRAGFRLRQAFSCWRGVQEDPIMGVSPGGGSSGDASRLNRAATRPSSLRFGRNTPGIPPSRALSDGRLAVLGAHATFSTGCQIRRNTRLPCPTTLRTAVS